MGHKVLRTMVDVPIRSGLEAQLEERILSWGQEHLFACSEERTIMLDDQTLTLTITWSESGPPDINHWQQNLKSFQQAVSDFVEWERVTETSEIIEILL